MGRRPKQEQIKKFLHNDKTRFLFSDAAEFANCFPTGEVEMYLKPVPKGGRMKKGHFQIVGHLPNAKSDDREAYLKEKEAGGLERFLSGHLKANRIRWNAGSYPGFHLILHDQNGRRQEFVLRSLGKSAKTGRVKKGALVMASMIVPSEQDRKLLYCPVQVGFFGPSASRKGEFKLTLQKPKAECAKGLRTAGHVSDVYQAEEFDADNVMSHEDMAYFYEAQGMTYDAESEDATYEPSTEPDMASPATEPTNAEFSAEELFCASCGSYKRAEGHGCGCMGAESESATYAPSTEPDMEAPATEPTNANFDAESWNETDEYTMVTFLTYGLSVSPSERVSDMLEDMDSDWDLPTLEWYLTQSLNGQGDWMMANYGKEDVEVALAMVQGRMGKPNNYGYEAESKSMFGKDKNGKMYARKRNGEIITHNAESLEDFNGMESVVVEPPLGHGVAQWYAETATYEPSSEPDMESPATEPTNANFESETRMHKDCVICDCELNSKTHKMDTSGSEGGAGGGRGALCDSCFKQTKNAESSPSSFDITWEDAQGVSSPSLPPEGIHFAESLEDYTPMDSVVEDLTSYQPSQDYGADFTVDKPFQTGAKLSAGLLTGVALFSVAGMLGTAALSKLFDKEE